MIYAAIVEDDAQDMERIKEYLDRYARERQQKFTITEFIDGEDIVNGYTAAYDLILMDIEMKFMDGMQAAKAIRELDQNVELIFITNMPQYAIQGYKVNALDYMLKPVSYFAFAASMDKALARIGDTAKPFVVINTKGGKLKLEEDQITYLEVLDHTLFYHTTDGDYEAKGTLRDAAARLDPNRFCFCNRCYLVNLDFVEQYAGNTITVNGDTITVSRSKRKPFLNALNERMNGEAR